MKHDIFDTHQNNTPIYITVLYVLQKLIYLLFSVFLIEIIHGGYSLEPPEPDSPCEYLLCIFCTETKNEEG